MKTKKWAMLVLGACSLIGAAGFGVADMCDYAQVATNRAAAAVRERIPLSVEIDRMEVVLGKVDQQLKAQDFEVAKAQVALEDAEAALVRDRELGEKLLGDMRTLRGLLTTGCETIRVGCHSVSGEEVRRVLASKLSAYQATSSALTEREQAVERQRQAYRELATRYTEWNQQRQLLSHRLEALKSRNLAQQGSSSGTGSFNTADLARAAQVADDIERKLRIAEKQQALGADPVGQILNAGSPQAVDIERQVDQLLGTTDVGQSK